MIFQKPIPLTKNDIGKILEGNIKYAVSTKCDGELVFMVCNRGEMCVKDVNNKILEKIKIEFDFKYVIHGERLENGKMSIFDFYCPNLNYYQRFNILKNLFFPNCFFLNNVQFPEIKNTFKILENMTSEEITDGFIFTPSNVLVDKPLFVQYPIYKWKKKSQLTADLLVRRKHVYCGISRAQYNTLGEFNYCFNASKFDYFGIIFGTGNESKIFCANDCSDDIPCLDCAFFEEKVVECIFNSSGWEPIKIRQDKTLQFKKSEIFSGPNNWKTVQDIVNESNDPTSFEELIKF